MAADCTLRVMKRLFVVLCVAASSAWADLPPADVNGCNGKAAGDACKKDDSTDGTCVDSKCGRLDYSEGVPPKSIEYQCLKCGAKAAAPVAAKPVEEKKTSCAAVPGEALLALGALLAVRRKKS